MLSLIIEIYINVSCLQLMAWWQSKISNTIFSYFLRIQSGGSDPQNLPKGSFLSLQTWERQKRWFKVVKVIHLLNSWLGDGKNWKYLNNLGFFSFCWITQKLLYLRFSYRAWKNIHIRQKIGNHKIGHFWNPQVRGGVKISKKCVFGVFGDFK